MKSLLRDMDHTIHPQPGIVRKVLYLMDSSISYLILGATQRDYLDFEFYRRPYRERQTFLTGKRYARMVNAYNRSEDVVVFQDKGLFIQTFAPYLGRACLDVQKTSKDEFLEFTADNDAVFVKLRTGEKGYGLSVEPVGSAEEAEHLYARLEGEPWIVEEKVCQHPLLAEFNPNTLNTLRIYTLLNKEGVEIISASLKLGRYEDSIADNVSVGGIFAAINPDTGIVQTSGVDKNHQQFEHHPLTGKTICGFQIPNWSGIVEFIREIAQVVPTVRYVGWDIGIDGNGHPLVIEGNHNGGRRTLQFADQKGRYGVFTEIH